MNEDIRDEVQLVMQHIYSDTQDNEPEEEEIIHVHHFPDANIIELPDGTVIFKKNESTTTNIPIVESNPQDTPTTRPPLLPAYFMVSMFLFLVLSSILIQLSILFHPPIATITIFPKLQQLSIHGTLQLGRVLIPITVSQSATTPTTGHGHQDATRATGELTFYNGSNTAQTINTGTVFTGNDGIQVATDQAVTIPATNPPTLGEASISAHAVSVGSASNIQALDINTTISSDLFIKNLTAFTGGQDERNFQTVSKSDIDTTAATLKPSLAESMQGALAGQLKQGEQLTALPCSPTVTSDHRPGEEAVQVKVMVSETCSGVAYNQDSLQAKVTQLLTAQAAKKLETDYSLLGNPQITVTSATTAKQVTLSFSSVSTWIYALSHTIQEHIKHLIAGKTTQEALRILTSQPGIERATIAWGDDTKLPKNSRYIHIILFVM